MNEPWRRHLLETPDEIGALIERVQTIAVLGIKTADDPHQAAWFVPEYAQRAGMTIIPVPVYFPDVTEILGERVYRSVATIPGAVDLVNVFRRPEHIAAHVDDILAKRPKAVWFQLGIRDDASAERFAQAGIDVVQDLCLLVEMRTRGR
ncbi:MAG: CoA-binding protein [Gemmatimonadales bacterium]